MDDKKFNNHIVLQQHPAGEKKDSTEQVAFCDPDFCAIPLRDYLKIPNNLSEAISQCQGGYQNGSGRFLFTEYWQ